MRAASARERRQIDALELGHRQAREVAELRHEATQRAHLLFDDVARVAEASSKARVVALVALVEVLHGELDGRERVLDLVGQASRHLLPRGHALEVLDAITRAADVAHHRVERADELAHLVAAIGGHLDREVAGADLARGVGEHRDAAREPARDDETDRERRRDDGEQHRRVREEVEARDVARAIAQAAVDLGDLAGARVLVEGLDRCRDSDLDVERHLPLDVAAQRERALDSVVGRALHDDGRAIAATHRDAREAHARALVLAGAREHVGQMCGERVVARLARRRHEPVVVRDRVGGSIGVRAQRDEVPPVELEAVLELRLDARVHAHVERVAQDAVAEEERAQERHETRRPRARRGCASRSARSAGSCARARAGA